MNSASRPTELGQQVRSQTQFGNEEDIEPGADAAWDAEIAKRIARFDAGESQPIAAAEVFAGLRVIAPDRMNTDFEIQRLAWRAAVVLAIPSWSGFIYALRQRPHQISLLNVTAFMPDVGPFTIAAVFCSLLAFLCAIQVLSDDFTSVTNWLFTIACAAPFFGMLWLLDPFGMMPTFF